MGRSVSKLDPSQQDFIYLGDPNSPLLKNLIVPNIGQSNFKTIQTLSPEGTLENFTQTAKILSKRYANISKVEEAQIVGILVGTVVSEGYR